MAKPWSRMHVAGLIAGLIAVAVARYSVAALMQCCLPDDHPEVLYVASAKKIIAGALYLLPGFVAGWVARTRGILLGFVTGLIGGTIGAIFSEAWLPWAIVGDQLNSVGSLVLLVGEGVHQGIACAAAGGAAELLRSKSGEGQ